jgi:hypothetical protein
MHCGKGTEFEGLIQKRIPTMTSQGDNCDGYQEVTIH